MRFFYWILFLLGMCKPMLNAQSLLITGAFDGPLSGGTPKGVELYAIDTVYNLNAYGLGIDNNGQGEDGIEFQFPEDTIPAGTFFYVVTPASDMASFFTPDLKVFYSGFLNVNGDDAVVLYHQSIKVDQFGDSEHNGATETWNYKDGWAYRKHGASLNDTFNYQHWLYSGQNKMEGHVFNDSLIAPFPLGHYVHQYFSVNSNSISFGYVPFGETSLGKKITLSLDNWKDSIALNTPAYFDLALDSGFIQILPKDYHLPSTSKAQLELFIRFIPKYKNNEIVKDTLLIVLDEVVAKLALQGAEGRAPPKAWINELHYDNIGTDSLEFIEVVVAQETAYLMDSFSIILYNGANGKPYNNINGVNWSSGVNDVGEQYYFLAFTVNGLQNGKDGVALCYENRVVDFLSYEGEFVATDGLAKGVKTFNLPVRESNSTTPIGYSLHFIREGEESDEYRWRINPMHSMGKPNEEAILPVRYVQLKAVDIGSIYRLFWEVREEFEIDYYVVEVGDMDGVFNSMDTIYVQKHLTPYYSSTIEKPATYWRVKGVDYDGVPFYSGIQFLPNNNQFCPTKYFNSLPCKQTKETLFLQWKDLTGKVMGLPTSTNRALLTQQIEMELQDKRPGVYILTVYYKGGNQKIKLIKGQ